MIKPYRAAFNKHFTEKKYQAFLDDIASEFQLSTRVPHCRNPGVHSQAAQRATAAGLCRH